MLASPLPPSLSILSSLPHPHLDTHRSTLLQKLLIKVRALTTGQVKEGGWMSGWTVLWFYLPPTSEPIFSFLFLYSSRNFPLFAFRFPSLLLPVVEVKKSNLHAFDLMDRVVSLICNNGLTPFLHALNLGLGTNVSHIHLHTGTTWHFIRVVFWLVCGNQTMLVESNVDVYYSQSGVFSWSH